MKRLLFTLFLALSLAHAGGAAASEDANELFLKGRALIENNCGDCHGGTRLALEEGIEAVKRAIELGYRDEAAASKALAEAYNILSLVYAPPDSFERASIRGKQDAVYKRLLELVPDDPQVRLDYAVFVDDAGAKLEHARVAATLAPEWADARFLLAATLLESGNWEEALPEAEAAIEQANCGAVARYGRRLGELFDRAGRPKEASIIQAEAEARAKTVKC
jgi:tetratricopeptide (TPR) repeat protein